MSEGQEDDADEQPRKQQHADARQGEPRGAGPSEIDEQSPDDHQETQQPGSAQPPCLPELRGRDRESISQMGRHGLVRALSRRIDSTEDLRRGFREELLVAPLRAPLPHSGAARTLHRADGLTGRSR